MPEGNGNLGDVIVRLGAETSQFSAGMAVARKELQGTHDGALKTFAGGVAQAAKITAAMTAATVAGGAALATYAGGFEELTTQIVTGAGESASNLEMVRKGILAMAGEVGQVPDEIAKGFYNVASAGFHGAQGLTVMKVAAMGAKVGAADLAVMADGLTTALNAYHFSADKAVSVTNALVATVASGKMKMQDLAGSLGHILPTASALKVSLPEVTAAIATMTGQGTDAAEATTQLRSMMLHLASAQGPAVDAMKAVGLTSKQVADTMTHKGLYSVLKLITDHISTKFKPGSAQFVAELQAIVGGIDGMGAALQLTGGNTLTFAANVKTITAAMDSGSTSVTGWDKVQTNFNTKVDQAKASLSALAITAGTEILPVFGTVATFVSDLIADLDGLETQTSKTDGAAHAVAAGLQTVAHAINEYVIPEAKALSGWAMRDGIPMLQRIASWTQEHVVPALKTMANSAIAVGKGVGQAMGGALTFVGKTLLPMFGGALGWVSDHGKVVEYVLGLIVERLIIMRALDMALWVKNFVMGFTAMAAGAGRFQAVMATMGSTGSNSMGYKFAELRGETLATSDVMAGRYVFSAEKAAAANVGLSKSTTAVVLGEKEIGLQAVMTSEQLEVAAIKARMMGDSIALASIQGQQAGRALGVAFSGVTPTVETVASKVGNGTRLLGLFGKALGPIGIAASLVLPLVIENWDTITTAIGNAEAGLGKFFGQSGQNWTQANKDLTEAASHYDEFYKHVQQGSSDFVAALQAEQKAKQAAYDTSYASVAADPTLQGQREGRVVTGPGDSNAVKGHKDELDSINNVIGAYKEMDRTSQAVFENIYQKNQFVANEFAQKWAANGHNAQQALDDIKRDHADLAGFVDTQEGEMSQAMMQAAAERSAVWLAAQDQERAAHLDATNAVLGDIDRLKTAYGDRAQAQINAYMKSHPMEAEALATIEKIAKLTGLTNEQVVDLGAHGQIVYKGIAYSVAGLKAQLDEEAGLRDRINGSLDKQGILQELAKHKLDLATASARQMADAINDAQTNLNLMNGGSIVIGGHRVYAEGGKREAGDSGFGYFEGREPEWVIPAHKAPPWLQNVMDDALAGRAPKDPPGGALGIPVSMPGGGGGGGGRSGAGGDRTIHYAPVMHFEMHGTSEALLSQMQDAVEKAHADVVRHLESALAT